MKSNIFQKVSLALFVGLSLWWFVIYFYYGANLEAENLKWAATYQALALWGGLFGLFSASAWGGFKSLMGRSILFFSIGLLLQVFGQTVFSYYNLVTGLEVPYPSIADIGFFGSVIAYLAGIFSILKISGAQTKINNAGAILKAFILPVIALIISYFLFLKGYEFDWSSPVRVFLDFGYPMGEAIYVSIAILVVLLSKDILGGIMRKPLMFFVVALIMQYCAEFNFLYQALNGTWINGGYGDYLYMISYFLMGLSLIKTYGALKAHQAITE